MSEPFVAEVRIWACNFAPRGWAFCHGQLLPIAQNTALFSLIGTTYGGDGRTTTQLPDLQGRAPMHPGQGPGLTPRRLGERGGSAEVTLSEAQMAAHQHPVPGGSDTQADSSVPSASGSWARARAGRQELATYHDPSGATVDLGPSEDTGGGQPHNNLSPYLGLNFCIALVGLYPSRS